MLTTFAAALFAAMMVKAGLGDIARMQISNRLVLTILAAYAILAPLAGIALIDIGASLAAGGGILGIGVGLFALGWIGGGDAKLAAVAALWLGAEQVPSFIVHTALAGGILALLVIVFRRTPLPGGWRRPEWAARLRSPAAGLPYGVAISSGALLVLGDTGWVNGQGF